jgi:hypothetical protein
MTTLRSIACAVAVLAVVLTAAAQGGRQAMHIGVAPDKQATWTLGKQLITDYHLKGFPRPIFWPVLAPGGQPLTRGWPMEQAPEGGSKDHVHQKSLWFCHGDVIPEGVALEQKIKGVDGVDFWSEATGHGKIVVTKVDKFGGGTVGDVNYRFIRMENEWRTADGMKIMDEDRKIAVHDLGKANLIVFNIKLTASVAPITFGDTKEGALGVRINDTIRAGKLGNGKIENAQGKLGEKECWGRISEWCDYSGPIDGKVVGLTVFADPKNAHPTYWHVRDYGLMAANPFGRKKAAFHDGAADKPLVKLAKGENLELRYGVLLHEGDVTTGEVAANYQRFVKLREKE